MMNRFLVLAGTALLLLGTAWEGWIGKRWTERITRGWSNNMAYIGTQTYVDPSTGRLPPHDQLVSYERTQRVVDERRRPRSVVVEDRFTISDLQTQRVVWDYATHAEVDPRTGARIEPQFRGEIVTFPREVKRTTYRVRSNYLNGIPLRYAGEERIEDLRTFVFTYHGRGEYTDSYRGYGTYAGVPLEPGQEIRCADDQFYYRVWVEPRTGAVVKLQEGCPSGSYIYDADGRTVAPVDRWSGVTTGDGLLRRIDEVRHRHRVYLRAKRDVPLALALVGVALLATGLLRRRNETRR